MMKRVDSVEVVVEHAQLSKHFVVTLLMDVLPVLDLVRIMMEMVGDYGYELSMCLTHSLSATRHHLSNHHLIQKSIPTCSAYSKYEFCYYMFAPSTSSATLCDHLPITIAFSLNLFAPAAGHLYTRVFKKNSLSHSLHPDKRLFQKNSELKKSKKRKRTTDNASSVFVDVPVGDVVNGNGDVIVRINRALKPGTTRTYIYSVPAVLVKKTLWTRLCTVGTPLPLCTTHDCVQSAHHPISPKFPPQTPHS
jgi:hypothetical protein